VSIGEGLKRQKGTMLMTDNQARQDEVKKLKEEGLTDEEIASRLGITEDEVQEISAVVIKPPDEENGDG
jgi:DNA-binding NarL/FixJ family response regulator